MKKLLLFLGAFSPLLVMAQTPPETDLTLSQLADTPTFEEKFFSIMDMKILHDRQIMQNIILRLAEQQNAQMMAPDNGRDKVTQVVFNKKDSDILETMMDKKQIRYRLTPELLEKADKMPFEAFKDLIRSASIPKISAEEMKELNQVDDKAIPQMMQMLTEAGPDVGAAPVSVIYSDEI